MGALDASPEVKEAAVMVTLRRREADYCHIYLGQQREISYCRVGLEQGFGV